FYDNKLDKAQELIIIVLVVVESLGHREMSSDTSEEVRGDKKDYAQICRTCRAAISAGLAI
ncbi:hypothetical protein, partial [Agrobacterium vitis]|uniref:hypothetical protein n=1 Tax=Agrobacterium vitis TaxID=373 RepID=UPI001AEE3CC1